MVQSRKGLALIINCALISLASISTACSTDGHHWKFTERTWGNPSDFLTEMTGNSQTLSDEELQILVENSLLYNPNLGAKRPQVSVKDQIVTLTGDVSSVNAKKSAENQIQALNYVKGVRNFTRPASTGTRHDPRLSRDAALALALNSNLVGNSIDVYVNNGIIYLTGIVNNTSQKELAGQIVALGRGSFLIKNHIKISSTSDS
ncbi:MAG: BON domain-containing protein [Bdellovibrionia bacterium]